ncbi:MAG TPA: methylenetetrahydrofolate reductase [Rhizomicrobium sp.]|nr:methylenetetrahydrofolate reductase [Rhizomicrobium sp.]
MSAPTQIPGALAAMLAQVSIEVTARERGVAEKLRARFEPGMPVHVTYLPDDARDDIETACTELRAAGYNPVPHLTARNFVDHESLERHLARLSEAAKIDRVLAISGDVDRPRGAFSSTAELMRTGLLEKYGVRTVLLAGHPEGHPAVEDDELDAALQEKVAMARERGLAPEIVTQFCFEAEPIIGWLRHIRALGIDAPVRVGVAGPAGTATLLKFAVRCGIGNSLRALRRRVNIAKLMGDTAPDEILRDVAEGVEARGLGPLAGVHIYMFGGMQKTSEWLSKARSEAAGARSAVLGSTGS